MRDEKNQTLKNAAYKFDEGEQLKHIFTFNINTSVNMELDPSAPINKRVSPIPDTSNIKVREKINNVENVKPITSSIIRVGSMFTGSNQKGLTVKMVVNGFTGNDVSLTNITESKTLSMPLTELKKRLVNGTVSDIGVYPLIEFNGEYYMYDKNTYYPLNPSAEVSEEIEKFRKEQGAQNYNSLYSHITTEMAHKLSGGKTTKVNDLDTEYLAKFCKG